MPPAPFHPNDPADEIVRAFDPVGLADMDRVALMNRRDSKYSLRAERMPELLERIRDDYVVLEVDGHRRIDYRNMYYDTAALTFFRHHHNGRLQRFKVRKRQYVQNGVGFFEIKRKTSQRRTVKSRIRIHRFHPALGEDERRLLTRRCPVAADDLEHVLDVSFRRWTMVHKGYRDRCTIDTDLVTSAGDRAFPYPWLSIVEVKQERFSRASDLVRALEAMRIRPLRISKYCLGILRGRPGVKYNRFKAKLRDLDRIARTEPPAPAYV